MQDHALGRDVRRRALAAAVRAAVAPHVPEVDGLVCVGVAAVAAVLRVRGVLELGERLGVVGHAEVHDPVASPAEVGDERIVGIEHEARAAGLGGHELRPAVGQQLELAVAVELVPEQVGEQVEAGVHRLRDPRQPGLVDLEEAELAARAVGVEKSRRHAPAHVRAGAVVHHAAARPLERGGEHRRGRRLAVRRRDEHAAVVELAGHSLERARREAQEQPAGGRGAAAQAEPAARGPDQPGEQPRDREPHPGTITLRQRCRTLSVAGVRPTGSPSA